MNHGPATKTRHLCRLATGRWSGLGLVTLALLAGCGDSSSGGGTAPPPPPPPPTKLLAGADVSALERVEQAGAVFRDAGPPGDPLAILQAHGANLFRLRLFVNPNGTEVQVNDLDYTIRMATRIKAAGAKLLLDLHYSDTWADPGHQTIPAAWSALDFDALEQQVESYSGDVIAALKGAGVLPDIVQVGNEIDAGLLWPEGRVGGVYDTPQQWEKLGRLLKAGIHGIRGALGPSDSMVIMLHYSQGGSTDGTRWFVDHLQAQGVPFDMLGLSYYPWWHGTISELQANLNATALRYDLDLMVVETSYPWRSGGWEGLGVDSSAMAWPISAQGQSVFLRDLITAVRNTQQHHGTGVVWWYPESVQVAGLFIYGGGSLALFDASGNVLPAASLFATATN
jgi:arabinogalactan endo-1,4-beta-galactosidase